MNQSPGPWPNRFIWHVLITKDSEKAAKFYKSLFDWTYLERDMGSWIYRMVVAGPGPIGGIIHEDEVSHPHWVPYVAVDDVDAAAARGVELGGSTSVPPTNIPQTGRFAQIEDPQGGRLAVYTGRPGTQGFDPDVPIPGRVCWNEILTSDDHAALKYYSAMFGWTDAPKDLGPMGTYHLQMLGSAQVGGLMKNPLPNLSTMWIPYFYVEDLDASTKKGAALGAKVVLPPQPIPEVGRFSYLTDPVGALFALFEPSPT
jgi:predicted enzyme related to lactoylglutathione lyase